MLRINSKFSMQLLQNKFMFNEAIKKLKLLNKVHFASFCNKSDKINADSEMTQDKNSTSILDNRNNFCFNKSSLLTADDHLKSNNQDINNSSNIDNDQLNKFCGIENSKCREINESNTISLEAQAKIVSENIINLPLKKRQFSQIKKEISELSKVKLCVLNSSVALSTYAFYSTICHTTLDFLLFGMGTLFISMTTQVLNQIIEIQYDKEMKRTHMRPLPRNRLSEKEAWMISALFWSSSTILYSLTAPQAILFSNGILLLYIVGYTPLKRVSNLSMHVGALVGALPAILGSYAATNVIMLDSSLLLAAYIMAWQYPHFYGILYQNKDDYKKAGFKFISINPKKTYIAYTQMIAAMFVMLYIAYRLHKNKILNDITFGAFVIFFILNMEPILKFIKNPSAQAKKIRMKSYIPFLIVLFSFFYKSAVNRREALQEKQKLNVTYSSESIEKNIKI